MEFYSKILPVAMVFIDAGAAIVYALSQDWRRTIYWAAASILTAAVTF